MALKWERLHFPLLVFFFPKLNERIGAQSANRKTLSNQREWMQINHWKTSLEVCVTQPLYSYQTVQPSNWTLCVLPLRYKGFFNFFFIATELQHCQSHLVVLQRMFLCYDYILNTELKIRMCWKNKTLTGWDFTACFSIFLPGSPTSSLPMCIYMTFMQITQMDFL